MEFGPDDLTRAANGLLRRLMSTLAKKGNFDPSIHVIGPGGQIAEMPFNPEWMNSGQAKERLFWAVRNVAKLTYAQAVIIATDGWAVKHSEEEKRRLREDPEYAQRYEETCTNEDNGIAEIVAAGFGSRVESILITAQSPKFMFMIQQHYERAGADGRHIIFGEKHIVDSSEGGRLSGRIAMWDWPAEQTK